jgi:branched-subunit amino acid ABC-type transport system permease component
MAYWIGVLIAGVSVGGYYCLVALGLQITYSGTRVLNFAQGDIAAFGGMLYWYLTGQDNWNPWLALLVVAPAGFALGALIQLVLRPFLSREAAILTTGVVTIGLSFAIEGAIQMLFGSDSELGVPLIGGGNWRVLGAVVDRQNVVIVVGAALFVLGLFLLLKYSRVGLVIRANAASAEGSAIVGVGVNRIQLLVFAGGAAMSAVAGALVSPLLGANFQSGQQVLLISFIALVLGGLTSAVTTAVGAVALAVAQAVLGTTSLGTYQNLVLFGLFLLALLIRPQGIATRKALARR